MKQLNVKNSSTAKSGLNKQSGIGSKKRRARKPKKTQHRLALKEPAARQLFGRLKRYWKRWDEIKRGELLWRLKELHNCSIRGLANDLGRKEATLRRYIMLYRQPEEERAKFRAGETAKRILARKAARDRDRAIAARLSEEKQSGAVSNDTAKIIWDFCFSKRTVTETQLLRTDLLTLLRRVREITRGFLMTRAVALKLPKKLKLEGLYRLAARGASPDADVRGVIVFAAMNE